jgi:hypothetical protein
MIFFTATEGDNFELEREFESPDVIYDVKTSRFRFAGHLIRRPEDLPQNLLLARRGKEAARNAKIQGLWKQLLFYAFSKL